MLIYEKKIIGYLINYYRKNSMIQLKDLLHDDTNNSMICAKATLYKIEKGGIVNDEFIYEKLANKLGKNVLLERRNIYKRIENYRILLNKYLTNFSKTELEKLETSILCDLIRYENVLYIDEILNLYLDIINFTIHSKTSSKENYLLYLDLKDKLDDNQNKLIIYFLNNMMYRIEENKFDYQYISKEYPSYLKNPLFYDIKLYTMILNTNNLEAYSLLKNEKDTNFNNLTDYHKYLLLEKIAFVQLNSEAYNEAYSTYLKCFDIVSKSEFKNRLLNGCYLHLGITSYKMANYDETVNWIMKSFEINHTLGKNLVFLCSALEHLHRENEIQEILHKIDFENLKLPYSKKIYQYYNLKYSLNLSLTKNIIELENYISDILNPYFEIYGSFHKEIIGNDLKKYVKITGNYKKYYIFSL